MKGPRLCEISDRLEELIEEHLTQIEVKIRRDYYLIDIAEEVADLNDLLASYKRRVELLEQLLDCSTPEARRHQIRQALEAQGLRVATDPAELARLYRKSHALLAFSPVSPKDTVSSGQRGVQAHGLCIGTLRLLWWAPQRC